MTDILLNEREQEEYRLGAALLALAEDKPRSGLAFEVSDELARDLPNHGGLMVPYSIRAGLDTATATKGQELKFTQPETFIDALRKRAVVIKGGATVLEGLVGDLAIPRGNAYQTASWSSQNPLADVGDTNLTLNSVAMSPKELIGTSSYSRQLLAISAFSSSVDGLIRNDLARVHASTIDYAALNGGGGPAQFSAVPSGSGGGLANGTYFWVVTALFGGSSETLGSIEYTTTLGGTGISSVVFTWTAVPGATGYRVYRGPSAGGESVYYAPGNVLTFTDIGGGSTGGTPPTTATGIPTGVLQQAGTTLIAMGANGQIPTWSQITSFEKNVAINDGDIETGCYIMTPEARDRLRITDRSGGTTSGWFILSDDEDINSYPILVSNQIPKTYTKGTSNVCHGMIFGAMSEIVVGFWGGFEIVPDIFRLKKQGMVELTSYQLVDVAVRHAKAFAVSKDVLT